MTDTVKKLLSDAARNAERGHNLLEEASAEELFNSALAILGDDFVKDVERHAKALRHTGKEDLQDLDSNSVALLHVFMVSMLSSVLDSLPSAPRLFLIDDVQKRINK